MLTEERYAIILDVLKGKGTVTVTELTEQIGASESTIRRDLNSLDSMGRLNKVHGGATALQHDFITDEVSVNEHNQLNVEEKKAIARYAASIIHDDDFVYIDSGSSTGWLIEYLEPTKATFVTNGIAHVKRLMSKNLRAYLIGGLAKPVTESIVGADAVNNMKKYNFTKCFLGTNGIHTDYGFTTIDVEDALVKMEAVNRSYASIVLADHTKFDKVTAVTFAGLKKSSIITDRLLNDKYADVALVTEVAR
jgi:DeoR family fructose operon transcriptional repressor